MTWDAVHTALIARIAAVNGTGGYTFNFSATGCITRTHITSVPDTLPNVHVCQSGHTADNGPELTSYDIHERFEIAAMVPLILSGATDDTGENRIRNAEFACEDLENAIIADRSLGGTVLDSRVSAVEALDGVSILNVGNISVATAYLIVETYRMKQAVP